MPDTKVCTGCGKDLPLDRFTADKSKADGLHTRCKACRRQSQQVRYRERQAELAAEAEQSERDAVRHTLQAQANRNAILALINAHPSEFRSIRERELRKLEVERHKPAWQGVQEWSDRVKKEISVST